MSGFIGTPKSQDLNIEKTLYIKKKTKKKPKNVVDAFLYEKRLVIQDSPCGLYCCSKNR